MIIGIDELKDILGVSRKETTKLVLMSGKYLPRTKGQTFRVLKEPFMEWLEGGDYGKYK